MSSSSKKRRNNGPNQRSATVAVGNLDQRQEQPASPEWKSFDAVFTNTSDDDLRIFIKGGTAINYSIMSNLGQGYDANQRIGRKIKVKKITMMATLTTDQPDGNAALEIDSNFQSTVNAKVFLLLDRQPAVSLTTTTPSVGEVFDYQTDPDQYGPQSLMPNRNNEQRFTMIMQKWVDHNIGTPVTVLKYNDSEPELSVVYPASHSTHMEWSSLVDFDVIYDNAYSGHQDVTTNNIYLGTSTSSLLRGMILSGVIRVFYVDT